LAWIAPISRAPMTHPGMTGASMNTRIERVAILPQRRGRKSEIVGKAHPLRQDRGESHTVALRIVIVFIPTAFRRLDHHAEITRIIERRRLGKRDVARGSTGHRSILF
jgi:hypothetical protein